MFLKSSHLSINTKDGLSPRLFSSINIFFALSNSLSLYKSIALSNSLIKLIFSIDISFLYPISS